MRRSLFLLVLALTACTARQVPPVEHAVPSEISIDPTAGLSTPTLTLFPTATFTLEPTATALPSATLPPTPPGIILFIGDGMGFNHRTAATWLASGEGGLLVMDNLPVHGSAQTASADREVTDSAAAATAIATGVQTLYQAVGVDPYGTPVTTILELAQAHGWSVGLVSTTSLAHATPASFAAHVNHRSQRTEIARQMISHQIEVLLGGGEDDFYPISETGCFAGKGNQLTGSSLIAEAISAGYTYICRGEQLRDIDLSATDRLIGLFGADGMQQPYSPTLVEMTEAALAILSRDPDGFFLMVEAGQIDWASHDNDAEAAIQLTLGLDAAVAHAQIFILDRPNTLLIITADHETGGMRLNQDGGGSYMQDGPFPMPGGSSFWVDWSSGSHSSENVPVTAQGPYAEMLSGEYPLTQIFETMRTYLEFGGLVLGN
ncbi:MAG: alkaline phosphatase [Chloroflexota bacterium]